MAILVPGLAGNPDDSTYEVRVTKRDGGVQEGFAEEDDAMLNFTEGDFKEVLEYPRNNAWKWEELQNR